MENRKSEPPDLGKYNFSNVLRAKSTQNVSCSEYVCPPSPALSTITLTPGRMRNIDQDMEALRMSRQDNPFLKQVIASRESLVETLEESESDDTNLMSQEFPMELDVDPLTLPEIHEHMIRSPPPTSWPRSTNSRVFHFPLEPQQQSQPAAELTWSSTDEETHQLQKAPFRRHYDRFTLLTPTPIRSLAEARRPRTHEDSVQLMAENDYMH